MTPQVSILGIPYDADSSFLKGCRLGPAAIRAAFHSPSSNQFSEDESDLSDSELVFDVGDLELAEGQLARKQIQQRISELLVTGTKVLSLGGDHSISYPILKGYFERFGKLNVLQFDAHPDLYDELDGNRFSHGCPFARACEDGLIERLVQVGIRTMNHEQRQQANRFGVESITMQRLDTSSVDLHGPVYITLDLDVLDPAFAPGISHYEPGGMSVREVLKIIQQLDCDVIGADIVELNPSRDRNEMTAMVAAKFAKELLATMLKTG